MRTRCLKKKGINYRTLTSFGLAYWAPPSIQVLRVSLTATRRVYFEGSYLNTPTMGASECQWDGVASPGILLILTEGSMNGLSGAAQEGVPSSLGLAFFQETFHFLHYIWSCFLGWNLTQVSLAVPELRAGAPWGPGPWPHHSSACSKASLTFLKGPPDVGPACLDPEQCLWCPALHLYPIKPVEFTFLVSRKPTAELLTRWQCLYTDWSEVLLEIRFP